MSSSTTARAAPCSTRPTRRPSSRKKDKRARQVQSSPQALPPSVAVLARALPPPDRDADGIADAQDACPDRPGVPSPDPIRNGCPMASEKMLLLPDADGHVGGVEVDDGKRRMLDRSARTLASRSAPTAARTPSRRRPPKRCSARSRRSPARCRRPTSTTTAFSMARTPVPIARASPRRTRCATAARQRSSAWFSCPIPDGHVGGVEVDDGKTKTLVAEAYASAEVAPDGTGPRRAAVLAERDRACRRGAGERDADRGPGR